jgi:hypothetical protein
MGKVVTNITEYASRIDRSGCIPVVEEYKVYQLPERTRKGNKQGRWHH